MNQTMTVPISTPQPQEQRREDYVPADRSQRVLAFSIDIICYVAAFIAIGYFISFGGGFDFYEDFLFLTSYGAYALKMMFGFGIYFMLNGYLLQYHGQTLGKRAMGIRIVGMDQENPGLMRLFFVREAFMRVVTLIPLIGVALPFINGGMLLREDRRCLHDHVAHTEVVKV